MELTFLGTSAGVPTRMRNASAILLNLQHPTYSEVWLFDCGEGTQHQLLRSTSNCNKLRKIFVTHLHGDHIFGLPGLLCSRSMSGNANPLVIYGPSGIKEFIESTLRLSNSWTNYSLEIVEISAGQIIKNNYHTVTACLMNHSIECYGYRIEECDKPGSLNAAELKAVGISSGRILHRLKKGEKVILDNGKIIHGKDYLSPSLPGKKLAIFGDTAPCLNAYILAKKVDLMVHEATLESVMEEKANSRGHSSSRQAAMVAKEAKASKLVITHISSRYDTKGCARLLQECRKIFPMSELAEDFISFRI